MGVPALATLVAAVLAAGLANGAKGDDDSPIGEIEDLARVIADEGSARPQATRSYQREKS